MSTNLAQLHSAVAAGGQDLVVAPVAPKAAAKAKSPYIVGKWTDIIFFITSPLWSLLLGWIVWRTPFASYVVTPNGLEGTATAAAVGIITAGHLFAVFFRSHLNQEVFQRFKLRFTLIPIALYFAMVSSSWLTISLFVLTTFWDVYHSSLQTFGLGRLYDVRAGADPNVGRTLDIVLNHVLYIGPIVAGATLLPHLEEFTTFEMLGTTFFSRIPTQAESVQGAFVLPVLLAGAGYVAYYIYSYWRLAQQGHRIAPVKVILFASTGITSIVAWGFNAFGEAFLIMNVFHAIQYFALVWWSENKNMVRTMRLEKLALAKPIALTLFLVICLFYGLLSQFGFSNRWLGAGLLIVSLMHFWFDGFIWSVRKQHV